MTARRDYPTAISGTWTDLERRAWYLFEYANAEPHSDAYQMAEAMLVLLGQEWRGRSAAALSTEDNGRHGA